jgi:mannose-6-phosphate isomerase
MDTIPFFLTTEYRDYVWGGAKLRPEILPTAAEAWLIFAGNRVSTGTYTGRTLSELAFEFGAELLGSRVIEKTGKRFPVLVKILDCAQWLSLQVHPNDEQAKKIEGKGFFGKMEAWHVLEIEPNAKIMAGAKDGVASKELISAIENKSKSLVDLIEKIEVGIGDTLLINPGTIHALGPGLLVYEIQQSSDLTYRIYDWERDEANGRKLHLDKAIKVAIPEAKVQITHFAPMKDGEVRTLTECQYFKLESISLDEVSAYQTTHGESFHGLTLIEGNVQIISGGKIFNLKKFDTLFIPACCMEYQIKPITKSYALIASA